MVVRGEEEVEEAEEEEEAAKTNRLLLMILQVEQVSPTAIAMAMAIHHLLVGEEVEEEVGEEDAKIAIQVMILPADHHRLHHLPRILLPLVPQVPGY